MSQLLNFVVVSAKTALDNKYTNGHESVPIKLLFTDGQRAGFGSWAVVSQPLL